MVDDNVLLIKGGRHILYEMANETYVSNDTDLRGRQPRLSKEGDESAEPDESSLVSRNLSYFFPPGSVGYSWRGGFR